jgi:hypothetical protein
VVTVTSVAVNLGSPIFKLAVEPEYYPSLEDIYADPPKRGSKSKN